MSKITSVSEDVKDIIKEIIVKYKLDPNSQIVYGVGSEIGDGYMSKTVGVDIISDKKTLNLFLKCGIDAKSTFVPLDRLYTNERHFFNVIYPELSKFAENKGVEDVLGNVPKCLVATEKNIVVFENLKKKGYEMLNSHKPINADHISATFKSLARFHAVSFAFRDQNKERYDEITSNLKYFLENTEDFFKTVSLPYYNLFLKELDSVKDKLVLDHRENVLVKLLEYLKRMNGSKSKNSILTKGDFWSNNLMYRYENGNKESPVNVMMVDWQTANIESVVNDLSMFLFTGAAKEDLRKFKYYLKIYHDELSKYMKKLGSDPEKIFPFVVLEEEWRQHCRSGFGMAIMFIHIMSTPKEDRVDADKLHHDSENMMNTVHEAKMYPAYVNRLKYLAEFCIENNFI